MELLSCLIYTHLLGWASSLLECCSNKVCQQLLFFSTNAHEPGTDKLPNLTGKNWSLCPFGNILTSIDGTPAEVARAFFIASRLFKINVNKKAFKTLYKSRQKVIMKKSHSECSLFTIVNWFFFLALDEGGCSKTLVHKR